MPPHSYFTSRNLSLGSHHGSVQRLELEMLQKPNAGNNKSWHLISTYHVPDSGLNILCMWMNSLNLPTTLELAYYPLDFTSEGMGRGTEEHVMEPGFDGCAVLLPGKPHGWASLVGCSPWGREELDMTERLHFHLLEKEMATHSNVLAWRIPGMVEPDALPSMGSYRVGHDRSDLASSSSSSLTQKSISLIPYG